MWAAPTVSGAAYTLWVATQGMYRRYIVIVFVINTANIVMYIAISMEELAPSRRARRPPPSVSDSPSVPSVRPSVRSPSACVITQVRVCLVATARRECVSSPGRHCAPRVRSAADCRAPQAARRHSPHR